MALIRINLNFDNLTRANFQSLARPTANSKRQSLTRLASLLRQIAGGFQKVAVSVVEPEGTTAGVAASQTGTFTGVATAGNTVTIAGQVFTAADGVPLLGSTFSTDGDGTSGTATTNAASLAASINANNTVNKLVTATSDAGVVTITAKVDGTFGNGIKLAESTDNFTWAGLGTLTGGVAAVDASLLSADF